MCCVQLSENYRRYVFLFQLKLNKILLQCKFKQTLFAEQFLSFQRFGDTVTAVMAKPNEFPWMLKIKLKYGYLKNIDLYLMFQWFNLTFRLRLPESSSVCKDTHTPILKGRKQHLEATRPSSALASKQMQSVHLRERRRQDGFLRKQSRMERS